MSLLFIRIANFLKNVNLYICIACCTFAPLISCSFLSINTKQTFQIYHFSQIVTCYASFHQLYLFTIFLYETVPPKRSRALPIVKSSCPPPKLRNRSKSSSELIPPAYVIGIFPHCPSICTSCSSIPDRFPSTSTPWIKNSSQ